MWKSTERIRTAQQISPSLLFVSIWARGGTVYTHGLGPCASQHEGSNPSVPTVTHHDNDFSVRSLASLLRRVQRHVQLAVGESLS